MYLGEAWRAKPIKRGPRSMRQTNGRNNCRQRLDNQHQTLWGRGVPAHPSSSLSSEVSLGQPFLRGLYS